MKWVNYLKRKLANMGNKLQSYFKNKMYELHFFKLLGFNEKDYTTYKIISISKKKTSGVWFTNNLYFPLVVIFCPYVLTIIHHFFETTTFNKSFVEICISGSITLLGINVIRTSSTVISEKLKYDNVPSELAPNIDEVESEIVAIKKKLGSRSWILSIIGLGLYFLQIGLFITSKSNAVYWCILIICLLTLFSIFLGRFISLLETNIFDKEDAIRLLFRKLITQKDDYIKLEEQLNSQGLL